MKKLILTVLFLAVFGWLCSKAFVLMFAYQGIEEVKNSLQEEFALTYEWVSSDLSGEIVFHDVAVTPYRLKRSYYIDELVVGYGSYVSLLTGAFGLREGHYQDIRELAMKSLRSDLEGRDIDHWLALEYGEAFAVPLSVNACFDASKEQQSSNAEDQGLLDKLRFRDADLAAMAIDSYQADVMIGIDESQGSSVDVSMRIETLKRGTWTASIQFPAFDYYDFLSSFDFAALPVEKIDVSFVDNGYFRRFTNYCAEQSGRGLDGYIQQATLEWTRNMTAVGLLPQGQLPLLYRDYLKTGGKLSLSLEAEKGFRAQQAESVLNKDLVEVFNIKASLNDMAVPDLKLIADRDTFIPPPVVEVKEEKKVEPEKRFLPLSWEALGRALDRQIRVKLIDGKSYEGRLVSYTDYGLEVVQLVNGGEVSYFPKREEIVLIESWR